MKVEGDSARAYSAVRTDSMLPIEGKGRLVLADDLSGEVKWLDATGETCSLTLGQHAIRIVRRPVLSRGA